jgi:hypothetical protein
MSSNLCWFLISWINFFLKKKKIETPIVKVHDKRKTGNLYPRIQGVQGCGQEGAPVLELSTFTLWQLHSSAAYLSGGSCKLFVILKTMTRRRCMFQSMKSFYSIVNKFMNTNSVGAHNFC